MQGSVAKWGNSLAVRLPRGIAEDSNLAEGDFVEIKVENGNVVISPSAPKISLDDLLAAYRPEHRHGEMNDAPRGNEVW